MGKGSSPAPDYQGAAEATADGNLQNVKYQTQANRPNVYTPWGNQTWTSTERLDDAGYQRAIADWQASGGDPTKRPDQNSFVLQDWSQNVQLSPDQQAALADQQTIARNQSQLAQTLQGQVQRTMANGFDSPKLSDYLSGVPGVKTNFGNFDASGLPQTDFNAPRFSDEMAREGAKSAYGAYTDLLKDQWQQDTTNLDTKLRLQGLMPGTEAYDNAAQNLARVQAQQQNQLADQAVITGSNIANQNYASDLSGFKAGNEAQQQGHNQLLANYGANQTAQQNANQAQAQANEQALQNYQQVYQATYQNYLQPLNSMNAVLSGNQVSMPNFPGFVSSGYAPGADYSGAASSLGQFTSGQDATKQAGTSQALGTAAMMAAMYFSDRRLKTNIEMVGRDERTGLNLYEFAYKEHPSIRFRGVMADEVADKYPGAVAVMSNGYKAVNYGALGIEFTQVPIK